MKQYTLNHLFFILIVAVSSAATTSFGASTAINALNKVWHHEGKLVDRISCYFEHEPICNYIPEHHVSKNGRQVAKFLFPMAAIGTAECRQMVKAVNKEMTHYRIAFEPVNAPVKGLALTIDYDPQAMGFEYETFTSIQRQPGIIIKLYHKDFIKDLTLKSSPVQHYAQHPNAQHKKKNSYSA